jgi:hypothetical protein
VLPRAGSPLAHSSFALESQLTYRATNTADVLQLVVKMEKNPIALQVSQFSVQFVYFFVR